MQDNSLPVLPYGEDFERDGFACVSERTGVTCRNGGGHGFEVARASQRVF